MDPSITGSFFYISARGGLYPKTMFGGLQYILMEQISKGFTAEDIDEAAELFKAHGEPFNQDAFRRILKVHNGHWPVLMRAVREGSLVTTGNVLVTIQSTDPLCAWVPSYIETQLMRVWYPSTVATRSAYLKMNIKRYMEKTCDNLDFLSSRVHDFGSRGASSRESAALGGAAHLFNFSGTDTVPALILARKYYNEPMAGFSIPAAEHFTVTGWGRDNELEAYRYALATLGGQGRVFAVVCDSYDVYHAVDHLWGCRLREDVENSGSLVVLRPDSGVPHLVVLKTLELLASRFGTTLNSKGYKVLKNVRVIHGDSINDQSVDMTLRTVTEAGFSVDNIAFGIGGELLQKVNRDTQGFAMKCSAVVRAGKWYPIFKDPIDAPGKRSLSGVPTLMREGGQYSTIDTLSAAGGWRNTGGEALETVYANGHIYRYMSLSEIRKNADDHLAAEGNT